MRRVGVLILAILIPVFVVLTSVEIAVRNDGFFKEHYENNNVLETIDIEISELMRITGEIQDYLLGSREDLLIDGIVKGQEVQVFNEREIIHMEDVKVLFEKGIILRNTCGLLILVAFIYMYSRERESLFKAIKYSVLGFLFIGLIVAIFLKTDFNKYFTLFHEIFFDNDYWILNPNDSILINMVNLEFFINIVNYIIKLSTVLMITIAVGIVILGLIKNAKERRIS